MTPEPSPFGTFAALLICAGVVILLARALEWGRRRRENAEPWIGPDRRGTWGADRRGGRRRG